MGESSNLLINPFLYARLPFDPVRDLVPIVLAGSGPLVVVTSSSRPLDSLAGIAVAARSGALTYSSSGNGSVGHLTTETWRRSAGIELTHVPYRGGAPAVTAVATGEVDMQFASIAAAAPLIAGGQLRALAVTSTSRTAQLPDVPTMVELGYAGFSSEVIYGLLAPARTPDAVIARVNAEVNRVLELPQLIAGFARRCIDTRGGSPVSFAAYLAAERMKWSAAVKASGASVD